MSDMWYYNTGDIKAAAESFSAKAQTYAQQLTLLEQKMAHYQFTNTSPRSLEMVTDWQTAHIYITNVKAYLHDLATHLDNGATLFGNITDYV